MDAQPALGSTVTFLEENLWADGTKTVHPSALTVADALYADREYFWVHIWRQGDVNRVMRIPVGEEGTTWCRGTDPRDVEALRAAYALR